MKFLVIGRPRHAQQGVTSRILQESREIINRNSKSGITEYAYSFADGNGGAVAIVNAESAEKLAELLMEAPVSAFTDFQTYPVAEFDSTIGKVIEAMKKQGL